jgi:hypothetical protein
MGFIGFSSATHQFLKALNAAHRFLKALIFEICGEPFIKSQPAKE